MTMYAVFYVGFSGDDRFSEMMNFKDACALCALMILNGAGNFVVMTCGGKNNMSAKYSVFYIGPQGDSQLTRPLSFQEAHDMAILLRADAFLEDPENLGEIFGEYVVMPNGRMLSEIL